MCQKSRLSAWSPPARFLSVNFPSLTKSLSLINGSVDDRVTDVLSIKFDFLTQQNKPLPHCSSVQMIYVNWVQSFRMAGPVICLILPTNGTVAAYSYYLAYQSIIRR